MIFLKIANLPKKLQYNFLETFNFFHALNFWHFDEKTVENIFHGEMSFQTHFSWSNELIISIERWTGWQPRNEKLMMKERYSTVNSAQNLLLSHITKVFSVKYQLQWWKSIIFIQLSTPPNLIKLLVWHRWTKLNIWKNSLKNNQVFLPLTRKIQNWWQNWVLSFVNVWQKKESLSVMENLLKIVWQCS